jgi:hypothetical protein
MEAIREKSATQGHKLEPEIRRYFRENLDIAAGWLELHETLRKRLLSLASDRKSGSESILRACPVSRDLDHGALSREFMARFPKIRAAIAK